jgi:hypothetical protein
MTMLTDVRAAYLTATATAVSRPTRVRGLFVTGTGTAIFRDGGSGGTERLTINAAGSQPVIIPANGIKFDADVHVTISGLTAVTVFHG